MALSARFEFILWPLLAIYLVLYIVLIFAIGIPCYLVSFLLPEAAESRLGAGFIRSLLVLSSPFHLLPPARD